MADINNIGATLETVKTTGINITVMIIIGAIIIGIGVLLYFLWKNAKRWGEFSVIILSKDGFGHPVMTYDIGGVFADNVTKNLRLFLKNNNAGLSADNIPYIPRPDGKKQVFLLKTGRKNFRYLNFNIDDDLFKITVGEEDVNWALNEYQKQKQMFTNPGLMQYLPYMMLAFVSLVILIIFIYFFKDFAVLKDVASELHKAVLAMQQLKSGIITS